MRRLTPFVIERDPRRPRRRRHAAGPAPGFTLIEVMVALAIVALALAAGLRAAGALTDNAQRLADVTAAQWCAENQLIELRLQGALPGTGDSEFSCTQLGRSYRGTVSVLPMPNSSEVRQVRATMSDDTGTPLLTLVAVLSAGR